MTEHCSVCVQLAPNISSLSLPRTNTRVSVFYYSKFHEADSIWPMKNVTPGLRGRVVAALLLLPLLCPNSAAQSQMAAPTIQAVAIGNGITLHYVDQGKGVPVIFVHGSLSDGGYWADQIEEFAKHYRAIAYSRRYNYPNDNPARAGYSAVVDAEDLAAFIAALHLGKVVVIGHSYGALCVVSGGQSRATCSRSCLGGTSGCLALGSPAARGRKDRQGNV